MYIVAITFHGGNMHILLQMQSIKLYVTINTALLYLFTDYKHLLIYWFLKFISNVVKYCRWTPFPTKKEEWLNYSYKLHKSNDGNVMMARMNFTNPY